MAFTKRKNNVVFHTFAKNGIVNVGFKVSNNPLLSFKPCYVPMLLFHNESFRLDIKKNKKSYYASLLNTHF